MEQICQIQEALDESAIVAITNPGGVIIYANDHFCRISQYEQHELIGQNHRMINSGYHPTEFFREMWTTIQQGITWRGEICNRAKDGSFYWVKTTIVPFLNDCGQPYQYISIRTDVTAEKQMNVLQQQVFFDDLTKLGNRRKLAGDLAETAQFHLFLININRFKSINDNLGYTVGDVFLCEVATRLQQIATRGEYYRIHNDEFVYFVQSTCVEQDAKKLLACFEQPFEIAAHYFYASASIGIVASEQGDTILSLLKRAGIALNEAKQAKGNQFAQYTLALAPSISESLRFETKIRDAILQERFELYYQPKFNIAQNEFDSMEALIRWYDSELGFVAPDQFIPFAEEYGLIAKIDEWVLKAAMRQTKEWNARYRRQLKIAVNISPQHLAQRTFMATLTQLVAEEDFPAQLLEIEITETTMMNLNEALLMKLQQIRGMGISIAIDDFGTGFSCLNYLRTLPITTLKINRSFTRQLKNSTGQTMVTSIISLGHALNLTLVAEGVEYEHELAFLKGLACESMQGYYFSKPLDVPHFEELLKK